MSDENRNMSDQDLTYFTHEKYLDETKLELNKSLSKRINHIKKSLL